MELIHNELCTTVSIILGGCSPAEGALLSGRDADAVLVCCNNRIWCNSPFQWHERMFSPWQIHLHFLLFHRISPFINQGGLDQGFQRGQGNLLPGKDNHHADLIPLIGNFQDLVDPSCFIGAITELSYRRKRAKNLLELFSFTFSLSRHNPRQYLLNTGTKNDPFYSR